MSFYHDVARCRALVAEAEVRVAKQRSAIARLHRVGANTSISEKLLTNYIAALVARHHELGTYFEPAEPDQLSTNQPPNLRTRTPP